MRHDKSCISTLGASAGGDESSKESIIEEAQSNEYKQAHFFLSFAIVRAQYQQGRGFGTNTHQQNDATHSSTMKTSLAVACRLIFCILGATAFLHAIPSRTRRRVYFSKSGDSALQKDGKNVDLDPSVAEKFKVVTCMSTSCSQKRKTFGMDSLATFGAFFSRSTEGNAPSVRVEEGPCLGACKLAPCVAIEHDDFVGNVALEGMTESEFSDRV